VWQSDVYRTAMRECYVLHHHAVSLRIAGVLETVWSVESTVYSVSVCACERFCTVRIHSQLVKVYGTHVRSQKQVWMWCSAFSHGRTRGQHVTIRTPKQMTMHVMQMPVIREDRCIKLTNVAHDLDISLCSVQCCPPPTELLKNVCTLGDKESHRWHKSCTLTGMLIKENSAAKCLQWQDTCWRAAGLTVTSTTIDDIACHAGVLFREGRLPKI